MSTRVNLLAPEVRANPYPYYAEMRRNSPVCQVDPGGLWAVSRYADVLYVLKNPSLFSSEGFGQAYRPPWITNYPLADSVLVMDPPRHTRLRALINRAFNSSVLIRIDPILRQLAHDISANLRDGQEEDFVANYAVPMPMGALGELLGLKPDVHPLLLRWAEHFATFTGIRPHETDRQQAMQATVDEARGHFERVLEDRRSHPGEDLISNLILARVDGEGLSQRELLGFMFLLLIGGLETTLHLMSHSALRLALQPELMTRLRADASLLTPFIDEALRHEPPAQASLRLTTEDVELGGVRLPKGTRIMLLLGSANRDEAQFDDPDRFDLERPPGTFPFGYGIHFCLGAQLARLEARLSLEALLARFKRLELGKEPISWNVSMIVRGPARLPLVPYST